MECCLDVIITTLFFSKVYIYHHFKISPLKKRKTNTVKHNPSYLLFPAMMLE